MKWRGLSVLLLFVVVAPTQAQEWAEKMFPVKKHNFGTVARGAKAEYEFKFKNLYQETIHIAGVRVSCGCTTARVTQPTVKSLETSSIQAIFNTGSFLGQRGATITVIIDQPYYAEVQLRVDGYIRSDVVFNPGEVNFGDVEAGQSAERKIQVSYAGRSNWRIVDVRSANEHVEVELSEPTRTPGRVSYLMTVRLTPDAPVGYFHDQLVIVSDDQYQGEVTLAMEGRVTSPLAIASDLVLGTVAPGESVTRNLVLRGKQAFRITGIECADQRFQIKRPEAAKKVHVIPVTFRAGSEEGDFRVPIVFHTDLASGLDGVCTATGSVGAR